MMQTHTRRRPARPGQQTIIAIYDTSALFAVYRTRFEWQDESFILNECASAHEFKINDES